MADLVPWGQAIAAFMFSLSNFEEVSVQGTVYEFVDNTGVISISVDSLLQNSVCPSLGNQNEQRIPRESSGEHLG